MGRAAWRRVVCERSQAKERERERGGAAGAAAAMPP